MSKVLMVVLALTCAAVTKAQVPANCVAGTNVYYISSSIGSDSNSQSQAKNKSTPWKHDPTAMKSFTGSYSHTAGDCFFWRFGDTWGPSDVGMAVNSGGSAGAGPEYHGGGDPTFGSGGRPKVDIASTILTNSNVAWSWNQPYLTFDDVEVVNFNHTSADGGSAAVMLNNTNHTSITRNYFHSFQFTLAGLTAQMGVCQGNGTANAGSVFNYNVVDGMDGATGAILDVDEFCAPTDDYNVINFVCTAFNMQDYGSSGGVANVVVAYNKLSNIESPAVVAIANCDSLFGVHSNSIQGQGALEVHDNLIHDYYQEGISPSTPNSQVTHIYNNVMYAGGTVPIQANGGPSSEVDIFNNTFECNSNNPGAPCVAVPNAPGTLKIENNHFISSQATSSVVCVGNFPYSGCASVGGTFINSGNVTQTLSAANGQGYALTETFAYSPTQGGATVAAGTNLSGSCNAAVALCTDTVYGVTTNGGSIPINARTPLARSASFDAGAYVFSGAAAPQAPTDVSATVN